MSQATVDYIKSRIVNREYKSNGEVLTESFLTFDNGVTVRGTSVRELINFDKIEAEDAAVENAISGLVAGVDFVLTK